MREDAFLTSTVERTKNAPWGLAGGGEARANSVSLELPDGTVSHFGKITRLLVPRGATVRLRTGGGGGYGDPAERTTAAVLADVREGYTTEPYARTHFPHAFEDSA
jgi:N-methylhydantoinase B